jgi:hypothetical protein
MAKPSRLDEFLAGVEENGHRGLPAVIAGASNEEAKKAFAPLTVLGFLAAGLAEVFFGSFVYGLAAVAVLSVVVGLAWRVRRRRRS